MRKLKLSLKRDEPRMFSTTSRTCSYRLLNGRGEELISFCATQFHAATGFKLKPGEKKRIEITIKEVK